MWTAIATVLSSLINGAMGARSMRQGRGMSALSTIGSAIGKLAGSMSSSGSASTPVATSDGVGHLNSELLNGKDWI